MSFSGAAYPNHERDHPLTALHTLSLLLVHYPLQSPSTPFNSRPTLLIPVHNSRPSYKTHLILLPSLRLLFRCYIVGHSQNATLYFQSTLHPVKYTYLLIVRLGGIRKVLQYRHRYTRIEKTATILFSLFFNFSKTFLPFRPRFLTCDILCIPFALLRLYSGQCDPDDPSCPFSDPLITMFTMFSMMLGFFETQILSESSTSPTAISLFVAYELMVVIILLNLLIAIMGDSYGKVRETEHLQFMRGRASLIDGIEATLSKEELQNEKWFPVGYIHILQRRCDEGDDAHHGWLGRLQAVECAVEEFRFLTRDLQKLIQSGEESSNAVRRKMDTILEELRVRQLSSYPASLFYEEYSSPKEPASPLMRTPLTAPAAPRGFGDIPRESVALSSAKTLHRAARRHGRPAAVVAGSTTLPPSSSRASSQRASPSMTPRVSDHGSHGLHIRVPDGRWYNALQEHVDDNSGIAFPYGYARVNPFFASVRSNNTSASASPHAEDAAGIAGGLVGDFPRLLRGRILPIARSRSSSSHPY